jgi:hypothetical protein
MANQPLPTQLFSTRFSSTVAGATSLQDKITAVTTSGAKSTFVVNDTQSLTSNVPANVHLIIESGGLINQGTTAITIDGTFVAGSQQVFTGTGLVTFAGKNAGHIDPAWFNWDTAKYMASVLASDGRLVIPKGNHTLSTGITSAEADTLMMVGEVSTNHRDASYKLGSNFNVTINDGSTTALQIGTSGGRFRDFTMSAEAGVNTGHAIKLDKGRDDQTIANVHLSDIQVRGFDQDGIHVRAPDNNVVIEGSWIQYNGGLGVHLNSTVTATNTTVRGLNGGLLWSRVAFNKGGNLKITDIDHNYIIGCGLLTPNLGKTNSAEFQPNVFIEGANGTAANNTLMCNDIENDAGFTDSHAAHIRLKNTRQTHILFNRIGAGNMGIEVNGGTSRSVWIQGNQFISVTNPIRVTNGGVGWFSLIGDNNGITSDNITTDGSSGAAANWMEWRLDRTLQMALWDSSRPIHINRKGLADVHFSAAYTGTTQHNFKFYLGEASGNVQVYRKHTATGTQTGTSHATVLQTSTINFYQLGVQAGQTISNTTDGSTTTVVSIDSATQITTNALTGGTDNTWSNGDAWSINDNLAVGNFGGSTAGAFLINGGSGDLEFGTQVGKSIVINETGVDTNFRVESTGKTNMLAVQASTNRVGVGHSAINTMLREFHVIGEAMFDDYMNFKADKTSNVAMIHDTTHKRMSIQRLSAAPTNAGYIEIQNTTSGSDKFYLVFEEAS